MIRGQTDWRPYQEAVPSLLGGLRGPVMQRSSRSRRLSALGPQSHIQLKVF